MRVRVGVRGLGCVRVSLIEGDSARVMVGNITFWSYEGEGA